MLRREDPIHLVETEDFAPFHVITKHADVLEIELHNKEWENAPAARSSRPRAATRHREEHGELLRTLIHMDDPDHRVYRGDDGRVVPAQEPGPARRPAGRAGQAVRRHDGRAWAASATSPATSPCRSRCR